MLITWRPVSGGAELVCVRTPDADITLPETIAGLPVTAVGQYAFSPVCEQAQGEQLNITCGISEDVPDNRALACVTLPPTLRRLDDYAFYNCAGLRVLRFFEPITHWGTGIFMNCRLMDTLVIHAADEEAQSVYRLVSDFSRELDITVLYPQGEQARLIFPGYAEVYSENISARHLDYSINGAGFPYHNMFRSRALVIKDYDRLWPGLTARAHDRDCALRIAWYRLSYPYGLTKEAEQLYLEYLNRHAGDVILWRITERDISGLAWFLHKAELSRQILSNACAEARSQKSPEALALLLEEQHIRFGGTEKTTFTL